MDFNGKLVGTIREYGEDIVAVSDKNNMKELEDLLRKQLDTMVGTFGTERFLFEIESEQKNEFIELEYNPPNYPQPVSSPSSTVT